MRKKKITKSLTAMIALLMLAGACIGTSLAFLLDTSDDVQNTFEPAKVTTAVKETINGSTKSDVAIRNTGNTDAYIRAAVLVTWQKVDENGNVLVYGEKPTADDYSITWNVDTADDENDDSKPWIKGADGFYYHKSAVAPNGTTDTLIASCTENANKVPNGYRLCVEIIGSGIQAKGVTDDGKAVVVEEWGVTLSNGTSGNITAGPVVSNQ